MLMSDEHYRIAELAEAAGVPIRAVHHYLNRIRAARS
jgi:DNA-directed RNA polymerase specialized sigma24 family protein